jgi:ferric-dicitrate binding protein FerR (iron transport regulator)
MNKQEYINPEYNLIIYNYLSHQATDGEKKILLEWIQESEDNRKLFLEYQKIFNLTLNTSLRGKFSDRRVDSWERFNAKISLQEKKSPAISVNKAFYYLRIAASVIIIFALGSVAAYLLLSKSYSNARLSNITHEIIVPRGGKTEMVLPDGTKVWLNAGSRFRYKGDYGLGNRNVYMEGEGYFSVVKNPQKPFIVNTEGLKIKAFGTSFNVKAYPDEDVVTTTLVEGAVKIVGKDVHISLKPKQVVILQKEGSEFKKIRENDLTSKAGNTNVSQAKKLEVRDVKFNQNVQFESDVNTNIYTSWKDNLWIIESESLKDIAVILERKFNVSVRIDSPELNCFRFTGTFNKETLEQILNVIKLTAPIKYEINKGIVTITEEQKRKATYNKFIK